MDSEKIRPVCLCVKGHTGVSSASGQGQVRSRFPAARLEPLAAALTVLSTGVVVTFTLQSSIA